MERRGMYGSVKVPSEVFEKLNPEFFISHCTDYIKYMNANSKEIAHLKSLGVQMPQDDFFDWFRIELDRGF